MLRGKFPEKEEEKLVDFFTDLIKGFGRVEALVYVAILYHYPATRRESLPKVLEYTLEGMTKEEIEATINTILAKGLLEADGPSEIKEPCRYGERDFTKVIINALRNNEAPEEKIAEFEKNFRSNLIRRHAVFLSDRLEEYCRRIKNATDRDSISSYKEDLKEVDENFSEVVLAAFSLKTHEEFVLEDIGNGLRKGINYRILLIHPSLAVDLEKPMSKDDVKWGESKVKGLIEEARTAHMPGKLEFRFIKNKEDANFIGLIKVSKDDEMKPSIYRCNVRRAAHERGVNGIVLRGKFADNTLLRILKSHVDSVWEKAVEPGKVAWLKRHKMWFIGFVLLLSPMVLFYLTEANIARDLFFFLESTILGIFLYILSRSKGNS
ncbi:MAG TPA: hypothetical protein VMS94_00915 [Acidobacteriota bacterium]|nr:hypothetical protein [Acidobacteriota bacterium]